MWNIIFNITALVTYALSLHSFLIKNDFQTGMLFLITGILTGIKADLLKK